MSRFYLTLPSNSSMKYDPENTVAQFTTKLNNVIELEGDWEVGLAEISVPSRVENAFNDECYFILRLDTFVRNVRPTARHYEQVKETIDGLHSALRVHTSISEVEGTIMRFYFDKNRIKIDVADNLWRCTVEFSPALARLLGFDGGSKHDNGRSCHELFRQHQLAVCLLRFAGNGFSRRHESPTTSYSGQAA